MPPYLPVASLLRLPQKRPTRSTTTPRLSERHPRLFVRSSRAPWDLWAHQGAPTCRWTPGTLGTPRIWQTRRRKDYFPRGRSCWRDSPLWNKKKSIHVQYVHMLGSVYCIHTINSDPTTHDREDVSVVSWTVWAYLNITSDTIIHVWWWIQIN